MVCLFFPVVWSRPAIFDCICFPQLIILLCKMKCSKCNKGQAVTHCTKCTQNFCLNCLKSDLADNQHYSQSYFFCQECQEEPATKFCFSCDQHLCELCNSKIHNKGKRAQHAIEQIAKAKFRVAYVVVVLGDVKGLEDSNQLFLVLCQKLPSRDADSELSHENVHLFVEGKVTGNTGTNGTPSDMDGFSYTCITAEQLNEEFITEYCKYFPNLVKTVIIDSPEARRLKSKLTIQLSILTMSDTSNNNSLNNNLEQRVNLSTSTENESITKTRKPPLAYFQFYKLAKDDKRVDAEIKMRKLAAQGVLILKRKQVEPIEGVIRNFVRTVGEVEVQYCSLELTYLSVESLVWIIRSIKIDCMTPGQKLILSRIKQSFDIKLHSKFWQSILNYLSSNRYQLEYDRGTFGYTLPKIIVNKSSEEVQLLLRGEEWNFEDQEKLDQTCEAWKDFTKFLLEYFEKSKTIPGGRYGCVQFVKTFGPESLRGTSLGKLSLFVQEAINKGIIRYHKTLLIKNVVEEQVSFTNESSSFQQGEYSFSLNEKSLFLLQKQLKIRTIQSALIKILLENQQECSLSLAQIPLFLKKSITFAFSLPELGFPKLKNLILTLSDKIPLQINKSTLNYKLSHESEISLNLQENRLRQTAEDYLKIIVEIISKIVRYFNVMNVDDLYTELNVKLGFEFEYRIFNAPDFCHFIYYFCSDIIHIEFMSGVFMAYNKRGFEKQEKMDRMERGYQHQRGFYENPQTSTPNFCNSFSSKTPSYKVSDLVWYANHNDEDNKEDYVLGTNNEENELIETVKFVDYLLNDDQERKSNSTYKTVIENQNIVNNLDWSLSKVIIMPEVSINKHNKALSQDFEKNKHMYKHNRNMSSVQPKENKD